MEIKPIINEIERLLAWFYGFSLKGVAIEHLISPSQLQQSVGDKITADPIWQARGSVWVVHEERELFVGIHLADEIIEALITANPMTLLADHNLDPFCVLIEELSHFHLILNRVSSHRSVTKLELEWQGEIDKLLICAFVLKQQTGNAHIAALAHRLYDAAKITAADQQLYWKATKYAAHFWYQALHIEEDINPRLRKTLQHTYQAPWSEKLSMILDSKEHLRKVS